jgi:heme/copper-type cytochrome/quinol oxidase subunit 2
MWKENKKGNVTLYFVFMIMAIIVLVVAGTLAPFRRKVKHRNASSRSKSN